MLSKFFQSRTNTFIFIIWLFHLSAIIGMNIGFFDWFLPKTPLNLLVSFTLLVIILKPDKRSIYTILVMILVGYLVEWVGVKFGFLFGSYYYGNNLGFKVDGVPPLIGINWAMLILITGNIASKMTNNLVLRVLVGSYLMIMLDFFIEPLAPTFGFWYWENGEAPLQNFVAWFAVAMVLHVIYQKGIRQQNLMFSLHLYLAQLIFFAIFYAK